MACTKAPVGLHQFETFEASAQRPFIDWRASVYNSVKIGSSARFQKDVCSGRRIVERLSVLGHPSLTFTSFMDQITVYIIFRKRAASNRGLSSWEAG